MMSFRTGDTMMFVSKKTYEAVVAKLDVAEATVRAAAVVENGLRDDVAYARRRVAELDAENELLAAKLAVHEAREARRMAGREKAVIASAAARKALKPAANDAHVSEGVRA
jgi:hypothetical protein